MAVYSNLIYSVIVYSLLVECAVDLCQHLLIYFVTDLSLVSRIMLITLYMFNKYLLSDEQSV